MEQFRTVRKCYLRGSQLIAVSGAKLAPGMFSIQSVPGLPTVNAGIFVHAPVKNLVTDHQVFPIFPLVYGKLVTRRDGWDDLGPTPRLGVSFEDNVSTEITPVDLEIYMAEGESGEGRLNRRFSRVELTFHKITIIRWVCDYARVMK